MFSGERKQNVNSLFDTIVVILLVREFWYGNTSMLGVRRKEPV